MTDEKRNLLHFVALPAGWWIKISSFSLCRAVYGDRHILHIKLKMSIALELFLSPQTYQYLIKVL